MLRLAFNNDCCSVDVSDILIWFDLMLSVEHGERGGHGGPGGKGSDGSGGRKS